MRPREEGHDDRVETSSYYTHSRARFESGGWGPIKKGSMSYFRTSYATLQELAKTGRYEDVAGFLVLARHASGWAHGQFAPYTLSGAGINSIHEKAGVSEEVARGVIERLKEMGAIRVASVEAKTALRIARWEINQGALDLDLPHALVDPLKNGTADSALHRVRKRRQAASAYASELTGVSDKELALDALMVLLGLYRNTKMCSYGGVSPLCIRRVWEVQSQTSKLGGSDGVQNPRLIRPTAVSCASVWGTHIRRSKRPMSQARSRRLAFGMPGRRWSKPGFFMKPCLSMMRIQPATTKPSSWPHYESMISMLAPRKKQPQTRACYEPSSWTPAHDSPTTRLRPTTGGNQRRCGSFFLKNVAR